MRITFAVDPASKKPHTVAHFHERELVEVFRTSDPWELYRAMVQAPPIEADMDVVVETQPAVYGQARASDILELAKVTGTLLGLARAATGAWPTEMTPGAWKGRLPKPGKARDPYIVAHRVQRELAAHERRAVRGILDGMNNAEHRWDVWDAVGIGLVHLGRLKRGLV